MRNVPDLKRIFTTFSKCDNRELVKQSTSDQGWVILRNYYIVITL